MRRKPAKESKYGSRPRGFTVLEVVLVAMIAVIALGVIYMFFARTQENFRQGNFKYIVQHEGQKLIDYVRQDLTQSCKYVSSEADINVPVVNQAGNAWSFCRFNREFVSSGPQAGQPIPEKVSYEFDRASGSIYRNVLRAPSSALPASERLLIARKVIDFSINPYSLNGLKYFQIKARIDVSESETHIRSEELVLITSVESRFDNNYIRQKGWNDNRQTRLFRW